MKTKNTLVIVDISSFIFRAFFAVRPLHAADGTPVNAIYGVLSMLVKLIEQYGPTHLVLAEDRKEPSFRKELYPEYKANRSDPPEELIPQFDLLQELYALIDIPRISAKGYEADDIIGSLVVQFHEEFDEVHIVSGDKDLMQFVSKKVFMMDTMKDKKYGPEEVYEKMGVYPSQVVDYLSLVGDSSDNIPGVKGVGAKGAAKILEEYKTLEGCLENAQEVKNKRVREGLIQYKDNAILSKKLIQIKTDIDLGHSKEDLFFHFSPKPELIEYLEKLQFRSLLRKFQAFQEIDSSQEKKKEEETVEWIKVINSKQLEELSLSDQKVFLFPLYRGEHELIQVYAYIEKNFYNIVLNKQLNEKEVLEAFSKTKMTLFESKPLLKRFLKESVPLPSELFDYSIAYFLINPEGKMDLNYILQFILGEELVDLAQTQGDLLLDQSPAIYQYLNLFPELEKELSLKLKEDKLEDLFKTMDLPLAQVLSKMENEGIVLDSEVYAKLSKQYQKELTIIENEISKQGGEGVNLRSPKQVAEFLFEKLELPVVKKTKTGYSTNVSVLEALKAMNISPVPELLLEYREIDKLLSTYLGALPELIDPNTKRIHPHFNQVKAATGRLACDNPNLQNIPIRTERGRKLREGFVAKKGWTLLGADYSQVELRILAHLSQDPTMLKAFHQDLDIHAQTASEIFETPLDKVTRDQRSSAKAINFGLMYGQSAFGLSQQLGISRKEAQEYIDFYFEKFSKVKIFLDSLKESCEKSGYAETMLGRKRRVLNINSKNRMEKSNAERIAINSPIQGSAADIIKLAMICIDQKLQKKKLKSKMLLQVHDELIFEVEPSELEIMKELVRQEMEGAFKLSIPLKVDMGTGANWYLLK